MAGTLQNVRSSYHHNKASKDIKNFYASWDLMEVTTLINLVTLVSKITGLDADCEDKNFQETEFNAVVGKVMKDLDCFSKWFDTESPLNYDV